MKDSLYYMVSSIVDNPESVVVEEDEQYDTVNFIVHVAKDDMGKVIGKNGKVIKALKNVLKIPAIKQNKRINISLAEQAE